MDEMTKYINGFGKQCGWELVENLMEDLKKEEFDTECIFMDIDLESGSNEGYNGNINIDKYGDMLCKLIKSFIKEQKSFVSIPFNKNDNNNNNIICCFVYTF